MRMMLFQILLAGLLLVSLSNAILFNCVDGMKGPCAVPGGINCTASQYFSSSLGCIPACGSNGNTGPCQCYSLACTSGQVCNTQFGTQCVQAGLSFCTDGQKGPCNNPNGGSCSASQYYSSSLGCIKSCGDDNNGPCQCYSLVCQSGQHCSTTNGISCVSSIPLTNPSRSSLPNGPNTNSNTVPIAVSPNNNAQVSNPSSGTSSPSSGSGSTGGSGGTYTGGIVNDSLYNSITPPVCPSWSNWSVNSSSVSQATSPSGQVRNCTKERWVRYCYNSSILDTNWFQVSDNTTCTQWTDKCVYAIDSIQQNVEQSAGRCRTCKIQKFALTCSPSGLVNHSFDKTNSSCGDWTVCPIAEGAKPVEINLSSANTTTTSTISAPEAFVRTYWPLLAVGAVVLGGLAFVAVKLLGAPKNE